MSTHLQGAAAQAKSLEAVISPADAAFSTKRLPADPDYINAPTKFLVEAIGWDIQRKDHLKKDEGLMTAYSAYRESCKQPPAIVSYIKDRLDPTQQQAGFSTKEFELLMAALIFRSSSTYFTVPQIVADLSSLGYDHEARIIERNANEEIGSGQGNSHAVLLYDSMQIMGNSLRCRYLDRTTYPAARYILKMRYALDNPDFGNKEGDIELCNDLIAKRGLAFPGSNSFTSFKIAEHDFKAAMYFCNLVNPGIADYHKMVIEVTRGRNMEPEQQIFTNILELATREASSVDEYLTGNRSYIGSWGDVVKAYLGSVKKNKRGVDNAIAFEYLEDVGPFHCEAVFNKMTSGLRNGNWELGYTYGTSTLRQHAMAWSAAHNDGRRSKKEGQKTSAESDHAFDAYVVAIRFLRRIESAAFFTEVLHKVTNLVNARLGFWDDVVERMKSLNNDKSGDNLHLPLNPIHRKWFLPF